MDFESSFELISQSEDVLVFYRLLGSLEVRTKRWRGLGRSSAFRKGNFLTEFYNLISAVGLALPSPSAQSLCLKHKEDEMNKPKYSKAGNPQPNFPDDMSRHICYR